MRRVDLREVRRVEVQQVSVGKAIGAIVLVAFALAVIDNARNW